MERGEGVEAVQKKRPKVSFGRMSGNGSRATGQDGTVRKGRRGGLRKR